MLTNHLIVQAFVAVTGLVLLVIQVRGQDMPEMSHARRRFQFLLMTCASLLFTAGSVGMAVQGEFLGAGMLVPWVMSFMLVTHKLRRLEPVD